MKKCVKLREYAVDKWYTEKSNYENYLKTESLNNRLNDLGFDNLMYNKIFDEIEICVTDFKGSYDRWW